jgi:cytochrome c-type biogenesis protein
MAAAINNKVAINEVFRGNFRVMCYTYTNSNIYARTGSAVLSSISFFGALGAGLLSFLSPCVLPLVPPYLCFLAGVSLDELDDHGGQAGWRPNRTRGRAVLCVRAGIRDGVRRARGIGIADRQGDHCAISIRWASLPGVLIVILGLHFLGIFRIGLLVSRSALSVSAQARRISWRLSGRSRIRVRLDTMRRAGAGGYSDGRRRGRCAGAGRVVCLRPMRLGIGIPFMLASLFSGPFMQLMARLRRHMATIEKVIGGWPCPDRCSVFDWCHAADLRLDAGDFPAFGTIG